MSVPADVNHWLEQIDKLTTQLTNTIRSRPSPGADVCAQRVRNEVIEFVDSVIDQHTT